MLFKGGLITCGLCKKEMTSAEFDKHDCLFVGKVVEEVQKYIKKKVERKTLNNTG